MNYPISAPIACKPVRVTVSFCWCSRDGDWLSGPVGTNLLRGRAGDPGRILQLLGLNRKRRHEASCLVKEFFGTAGFEPVFSFHFSVFSFQFSVFRVQFSGCRVENLEISSYSCDSFYSCFPIFAFFDKDVIHESNAVFHGLA
jgi:hypothetical protein